MKTHNDTPFSAFDGTPPVGNPITSDYFERERLYRKRHKLSEDAIIFPTELYTREEMVAAAKHEIRRCMESGVAA